jgi:uncharacterized membrane protein YqjE
MELDPSPGTQPSAPSLLDSIRDLVAFFVRYLELRLQLLGLESRETAFHLLILALLFVSVLICFAGFITMLVVFLLYLMMLILHWEWGWSALALALALLIISIGMAVILKLRIAQPFFPETLAEFRKDREWLKHTSKNSK